MAERREPRRGRETRATAPRLGRDALSGRLERALTALEGLDSPGDQWRRGWILTAVGRYGQALEALEAARDGDDLLQACADMTEAMLLRQIALHVRAEEADARALEHLRRSNSRNASVRAAIRIGQVADAVGMAADDAALSRRLQIAAAATTAAGSWRQQVRLAWVRGEVHMVRGRFAGAAKIFAKGAAIASEQGADRHTAKSLIFLAAARAAGGERLDAARVASRGLHLAARCGAAPLLWPAELILAELDPDGAQPHLDRARGVVTGMLQTLPDVLREEALRRPPVSWLVEADPDNDRVDPQDAAAPPDAPAGLDA